MRKIKILSVIRAQMDQELQEGPWNNIEMGDSL